MDEMNDHNGWVFFQISLFGNICICLVDTYFYFSDKSFSSLDIQVFQFFFFIKTFNYKKEKTPAK